MRDLNHACMALVTELKKTNSENEVKKNGRNRAEDVPGAFAEGLREIAEGDISGPNFLLLLLLVFPVVFPSCVSVSA